MPQGVEHANPQENALNMSMTANSSEMPQGVEHFPLNHPLDPRGRANSSEMPKGVEHSRILLGYLDEEVVPRIHLRCRKALSTSSQSAAGPLWSRCEFI